MLTTFRKFQKGTLIVVTIIIVIAFAFLYSDFDFAQGTLGSSECVIKVHDRCYRVDEAQKLARFQGLAMNLGMGEFTRTLTGIDRLDQDPTNFVMNMLVLRKAAEKLGVEPSATEIKQAVPKLPFVQMYGLNGDNMRNLLGQFGLDEGDLAQLVKDYLSFNKLKDLVGSGIQAVPTEIEKSYIQRNQRYTASVIRFDRSDFEESAKITDAEVKKYFEDRNKSEKPAAPAEPQETAESDSTPDAEAAAEAPVEQPASADLAPIMTAPKRGFDYVKFVPEKLAEDATQEEKAKSEIAFAKQVNRMYSELAAEDTDFLKLANEMAKKDNPFTIEVGKFEPFKWDDAPEVVKSNEKLRASLFSGALQKGAVSVPFSQEDGSFYVFRYSELVEPRQMTLEEARPLIIDALKAKKSNQLASDAANEALAKLQEAIDNEKSILDAASANNYDLTTLPTFSEAERPEVDDAELILDSVRDTAPGKLSGVKPRSGGKGYFIAYVDKIEIYKDEDKESNLKNLASNAEFREKTNLFQAWLNKQARDSGAARNDSIMNYPNR
ncbi:MAG: SurA N-terminal domain-containing protein [Verrucomicrobiales bacterium]|nr:SurA N-terminal domain-containing protein [Verrucomicrobiales bacterium]